MRSFPGKPPRYTQENSPYFLTFCTLRRRPLLHQQDIPEFLIQELHFYSSRIQNLVAYTIMPDHIHAIVEIEKLGSLSAFLRDFKKFTSVEIKRRLEIDGTNFEDRIWQPGTMDHCIRLSWNSKDYENHLGYLFYNSQKHLGIAPRDFSYHNFTEFVRQGYFDDDFCSVSEGIDKDFMIYE